MSCCACVQKASPPKTIAVLRLGRSFERLTRVTRVALRVGSGRVGGVSRFLDTSTWPLDTFPWVLLMSRKNTQTPGLIRTAGHDGMMTLATETPNNKHPRGHRQHQEHVATCWKATGTPRLKLCKQEGKTLWEGTTPNQEQKNAVQVPSGRSGNFVVQIKSSAGSRF